MDNLNLQDLLDKIAKLEKEQDELKQRLSELESAQIHDHELILDIQKQLTCLYREIEDVKKVLSTKIEEGNKLILEQNKLMMENASKQSTNFLRLITFLIGALLLLIGVKGIGSLPFF